MILTILLSCFSSGTVCSVVTWFLTQKKYGAEVQSIEAEVQSTEIDNLEKAVKVWRETAEYQSQQVVILRAEVDTLRVELHRIEKMYADKHAEKCRTCKYKLKYNENQQSRN